MKTIETIILTQGIKLELVEDDNLHRYWNVVKDQSVIFSDQDAHLVLMMVNGLIRTHTPSATGETIITSQQ